MLRPRTKVVFCQTLPHLFDSFSWCVSDLHFISRTSGMFVAIFPPGDSHVFLPVFGPKTLDSITSIRVQASASCFAFWHWCFCVWENCQLLGLKKAGQDLQIICSSLSTSRVAQQFGDRNSSHHWCACADNHQLFGLRSYSPICWCFICIKQFLWPTHGETQDPHLRWVRGSKNTQHGCRKYPPGN